MSIFFKKFSKKWPHHFKVENFWFVAFFLPALVVFFMQLQQTKTMLNYKSFTKIQSLKATG